VGIDAATYCVLRARPRDWAEPFWEAAEKRSDTPDAIRAFLAGRMRVELSRAEAAEALDWAAAVDGWADAEPKPLFVYDPAEER
jgi:hypothetical protein